MLASLRLCLGGSRASRRNYCVCSLRRAGSPMNLCIGNSCGHLLRSSDTLVFPSHRHEPQALRLDRLVSQHGTVGARFHSASSLAMPRTASGKTAKEFWTGGRKGTLSALSQAKVWALTKMPRSTTLAPRWTTSQNRSSLLGSLPVILAARRSRSGRRLSRTTQAGTLANRWRSEKARGGSASSQTR